MLSKHVMMFTYAHIASIQPHASAARAVSITFMMRFLLLN